MRTVRAVLTPKGTPEVTPAKVIKRNTKKLKSQNVPCAYPNETAVMFATGPGLTQECVDMIEPYHRKGKLRAFGCNDAYTIVPYLDVHYSCDGAWWDRHPNAIGVLRGTCHIWTQERRSAEQLFINYINGSHREGFFIKGNDHIHYGSNSGFQQMNLAWHYGIRKFLLVGYDMNRTDGKHHFFGEHPDGLSKSSPFKAFIRAYDTIQPEIKPLIINCTPRSALHFPYTPLEKALKNL